MAVKLGPMDWWPCKNGHKAQTKRIPFEAESRVTYNHAIGRFRVFRRTDNQPRYARHWAQEKARRFRLTSVNWTTDTPESRAALERIYRAVMGDE